MNNSPGSISTTELYRIGELRARLAWGRHTYTKARREGLGPIIKYGRWAYIRGSDVLRWFDARAEEQAAGGEEMP